MNKTDNQTKKKPKEAGSIILLGTDTPIGLAIIRELSEHGVKVIGLGRTHQSIGGKSKKLAHYYVRKPKGELLTEQLTQLAKAYQSTHLMAISEADITWLNQNRHLLSDLKLLIPEQKTMDLVLNKSMTYEVAQQVGIETPSSFQISHLDELDALSSDLSFPLVLKWANPQEMVDKLHRSKLPLIKAQFVDDLACLRQAMTQYESIGEYPLIQDYVHGNGLGQFFLIHNGTVIQRFQHQRLHEWPPEGGTSTLCQGLDQQQHQQLMQKSEALLKALNWQGVAMVEYRHDSSTGRSCLMEINGRFWGSYPLAQKSGADFAWLWFAIEGLGLTPTTSTPKVGLKCRFIFPELRRLFRVVFTPKQIKDPYYVNTPIKDLVRFITLYLHPKTCYYVFSIADWRPFYQDVKSALKKGLSKRR